MDISLIDFGGLDEVEIQALGDGPLLRLLTVARVHGHGGAGHRPQWDAFISDGR
jgi:hypothetical protein